MKNYCAGIVLALCLFLPVALMAQQQDITGMWYGEIVIVDSDIVHLPYEVAVSGDKGKLTGYSRIVFHANGQDEPGVQNISIKQKGDEIIMEDEGFIAHRFSVNPTKRVKKTLTMKLVVSDTNMIMEGSWNTNRTRIYRPYKGTAVLKRKIDFKKTELFKSLDTLKLADKLSFKDRPETAPVIAVAKPVEKKPEPVVISEAEPEPDLIVPAVEKASAIVSVPVEKKPHPSPGITAMTKQKKMQMDAISKASLKAPPVVIAKPEAVVAAVAPPKPKPEKKLPPVVPPKAVPVAAKVPVQAEKKPDAVAVKIAPKPLPAPVAIIAPSVTKGAAELDKRVTKAEDAVYFEQDSLTLTLYDNGEVDGDTVTVVMNGNIIFSKTLLTTKANTKTIYTRDIPGDSVSIVMYAESLGEIPPNTGLMVIMDGEKRYEVRFSADLKTNAAIILRRKKG